MSNLGYTKHIYQTIESFHACSHMPIKAYDSMARLIHEIGWRVEFESYFIQYDILKKVKMSLLNPDVNLPVIDTYEFEGFSYTICTICPVSPDKGFYILGPYYTDSRRKYDPLYKPMFCIPHMVKLLHSIAHDMIPMNIKRFMTHPTYNHHVKKAIDYINGNFNNEITLDSISDHLNINKCYFCKVFKKETGKTYSQYLNEVRINKSKKMLLDHSGSILDIALAVGFNNQNYFSMVFRKQNAMSPLEYRKSAL